jgi:hypothetical protein
MFSLFLHHLVDRISLHSAGYWLIRCPPPMPHTSSTANGAPTEQQPLAGIRGALSRAPGVGGTSARSEEDASHMLLDPISDSIHRMVQKD